MFDKICLGIVIVTGIFSLYLAVSFIVSLIREKEKAVVGSLESLISITVCVVLFSVMFFFSRNPVYGAVAVAELFAFPCTVFAVLTPKGISLPLHITGKYKPVSELSYQFNANRLEMYFAGKKACTKYHIGIKNIKTVKMLADYYPKHGYTNPLAPAENDNKGE